MRWTAAAILGAIGWTLLVPADASADDHPLNKDRTGMPWVLPFEKAREEARARKRLLLIKPVAFGTTRDGGW